MAWTYQSQSSAPATGTTSLAVPYPSGIAAGDLLVLGIANKYPANAPTTPAGWTLRSGGQTSGGSGASGVDTGSVYASQYYRLADGTESGNLSVTITSGNAAVGVILRFSPAAGYTLDTANMQASNGSDNSAGTAWSVTGGNSISPALSGGSTYVVVTGVNTDAYTFASHGFSCGTGVFTRTERVDSGTTSGDDCALVVCEVQQSSGSASGNPVYTATASGSAADAPAGASVIIYYAEKLAPAVTDPLGAMGFFGL